MGSVYPLCLVPPQLNFKKKIKMLKNLFFILILTIGIMANEDEVEKEEMLDGAESQNYGYGYGTKVDTPHGSSTVYVHGFGTDDTYHDAYAGHQAYGYGHIDPYLNHKQGYGYTKPGYGYNSVYAPAHHAGGHHLGGVAPHGVGHLGVAHHGVAHHGVAHHGVAHHGVAAGYGAGYGAPQPFVGSGFRYGHGYGYGYGHISHH